MRLKLVPQDTNIDFFKYARLTFGASIVAMVLSIGIWLAMGLNFGIDFLGGTTIRTESSQPVDVGAYRDALTPLNLGDVSITEVFDPTFDDDRHVAMIRIQAQEGQESVTPETVAAVQEALRTVYPEMTFPSVEIRGPQGLGRADHHRAYRRGCVARGASDLHLAAVRMAVLRRCRGRADP